MVKLTIGLSALAVGGFYYLAAAPPALAGSTVCQAGNYSDACPLPSDNATTNTSFPSAYTSTSSQKPISVPEPGTVTALLLTGAGMLYSGKKRKQVNPQR